MNDYTELWKPLISANETLDRIEKDRRENSLWRKNDYTNYQELFTNVTMEYLLHNNPNNEFINIFGDGQETRYWENFKLDGLIYDTTDNVFHIVLFKYYLNERGLSEIDETLEKFRDFIQLKKPDTSNGKGNLRRWLTFFDDECGIILNENKNDITMSVFIGFENVQSKNIISIASEKKFTIIEPDKYHYKVRTSTTF
jgi:hypothetical protein